MPNVLQSNYADVAWSMPLDEAYRLRLGAQAMYQSGVGEQLLTGSSFSTWSGGLKADLTSGGATATLAYQQTGTGSNYQTPYSGWAGYTYMIVKSFNQAGMKAWLLGGTYDFAAQNLPGLALNAAIVYGYDAINAVHRRGAAQLDRIRPDAGLPLQRRSSGPNGPGRSGSAAARPMWTCAATATSRTTASSSTTSGSSESALTTWRGAARSRCRPGRRAAGRCAAKLQIISPRHSITSWCAWCSDWRRAASNSTAWRMPVGWSMLGLLDDRQVHRQVQEGVLAPVLDAVDGGQRRGLVGQLGVVFGVLVDPARGLRLQRRQRQAFALLAPGVAEEGAHVVLRGLEHPTIVDCPTEAASAHP